MASPPEHVWTVGPEHAGERLDRFLAARLGVGRGAVQRLLEARRVRVDGRHASPRSKGAALMAGSAVQVADFVPPARIEVRPQPELPLAELARGEGWLAVDKPAGIPVHPLREGEGGTVLNALVARVPSIQGVGEGGLRSGVVHRLDVGTSGALLFATAPEAWQRLRDAFRAHRVAKRYRALVHGRLEVEGALELPLAVTRHRPARVSVVPSGSGARITRMRWRALQALAGATLVEVELETGFLHQIRVGLAHLGHPVLGDRDYGGDSGASAAASRPLLHAARLALDEVEVECPDPADFSAALRQRVPDR